MDLEKELRESLRRVDPPAGFAERVLAKVEKPRRMAAPRWVPWAVAACLMLSGGGIGVWKQRHEEAQAREAGEKLLLALQVTQAQLQHVRTKVKTGLEARGE